MAIAYDATSYTNFFTNGGVTSVTRSHTTYGSDRLLIGGLEINAGTSVTGVTYNSAAMTFVDRAETPSDRSKLVWYLLNPTTGANNMVWTFSSAAQTVVIGVNYTGVKQTAGFDTSSKNTATAATSFSTTLTAAGNTWTMMLWRDNNGGNVTAGSGTTVRLASEGWCDSNANVSGSTSLTITGSSRNWGGVMMSFISATAAGPAVKTINGLAYASAKTIDAVAIASVKSVSSIT